MRFCLIGWILLYLCGASAFAAPQLDANIRTMVNKRIESGELSSVVIGVIDGNDSAVIGFGKVGKNVPDAQTIYEIGSVTKTFTAFLLAHAVKTGVVKLDQTVATLLPGYAIPELEGKPITLLDLATHYSGLPRMPDNFSPKQLDNPYADYTTVALKNFLASYHLPRAAGMFFEYSNLGYALLGQALSVQADMTYADLIKKKITTPLGMTSTDVTFSPAMQSRLATGHNAEGKSVANWDMTTLAGAGGLHSDAQDLILYLQALMHPSDKNSSPLVLVQTVQRPTDQSDTNIGLAWNIQQLRGQSVVWHNGMTGGYASYVGFTADGQHGVVILSNTARFVDDIGFAILVPGAPPAPQPIVVAPRLLADYSGRYALAPNVVVTIEPSAIGLTVQATGQQSFSAYATARDEFFLRDLDAQLSFRRNTAGAVEAVMLHQNGHDSFCKKLPGEMPGPATYLEPGKLQQYVGIFTLEGGWPFAVAIDNNQLYGQAKGQGRFPLQAVAPDEFSYAAADIKISFKRDLQGSVNRLILHQGGNDTPAPKQ